MKLWIYRIFLIICIALVLGFILYNSTRTGKQSSNISGTVTDKVVEIVVPEVDEMQGEEKDKKMFELNVLIRNIAHVVEFVALTFFVALLTFTFKFNYGRYLIPMAIVLLSCFTYALCDELIHGMFDARISQISDVAMDMLGVVIGLIGAIIVDFIGLCFMQREKKVR